MTILVVLLLYHFASVSSIDFKKDRLADVLTVSQRIDLFGTNSSENLPDVEYVTIRRLDVSPSGQSNHGVHTKRYQIRYKGETMNYTLKQDENIISPGCLVHHHPKHRSKILYPCSRSLADCFYTGYSDSHNASWIAASTCRGLKGMLTIGGSTLVIAPLHEKHTHDNQSEEAHAVYNYISTRATWEDMDKLMLGLNITNRNKRSLGSTRYIETRVVVDPDVHSYHRGESEEYVQTVFNIASRLYEDNSMDMDIKLCLTEIYIYESYDKIGATLEPAADKTLHSFCNWIDKNATTEIDCSLLLTKVDLRYQGSNSAVGLANPRGMCKPRVNCVVVEDVGPASGPVIAHEIGHLLGMIHNVDTSCSSQAGIMSVDSTGPDTLHWTKCSVAAAKQFVSSPEADCLLNAPLGNPYSVGFNHSFPLPGTLYPRERQCQLLLGPQARVCKDPYTGVCSKLACIKAPGSPCVVYGSNILDGTDCNNARTWCMYGRCVPMTTASSARPVDGAWTDWDKDYSRCTRHCGGGVRMRTRRCENPPPQYGGKACVGKSMEAALCNMEPCKKDDFKSEQCAELARQKNQTGHWTKVDVSGDAGCLLWCRDSVGLKEIRYQHDRPEGRYKDGTKCDIGSQKQYGRCVEGKCKSFGCDGAMDSGVVYDKCGVCGGTGSLCYTVTGSYNKNDKDRIFTTAYTIPKGSYGVRITQRNSFCFLSAVVNGKRVFNAAVGPHRSGIFTTDGVRIKYTSKPERIEIEGPTVTDIDIQVYRRWSYTKYQGVSPQVDYVFYRRSNSSNAQFHWSVQYTPCSKSCGLGYRTPNIHCVDQTSGPVDDRHCDVGTKPSEARETCNTQQCPPTWIVSSLGSCSKSCGHDNVRNRNVVCATVFNGTRKVFSDSSCASQRKPHFQERCAFVPCPPMWKIGPWSQCTKSCSEGVKRRIVECYYGNGTKTDENDCVNSERPTSAQSCSNGPCPHTPYGRACKDSVSNCKVMYGADICYGTYAPWAKINCPRSCEICSSSDAPRCSQAVCESYADWAAVNCPNMCNKDCTDAPQCTVYRDTFGDICHQDSFRKFVEQHCPRMCHLCPQRSNGNDCKDNNKNPCGMYGHGACTNAKYMPYMKAHCAKFCGFC